MSEKKKRKRLIGYNARAEVRDAVDQFARKEGLPDRAAALELLLIEALRMRGIDVNEKESGYLPDQLRSKRDKD